MISDQLVRSVTGRTIDSYQSVAIGTGYGTVGQVISVQLADPLQGRSTLFNVTLLNTVAPSRNNLTLLQDTNGHWWGVGAETIPVRETVVQHRRRTLVTSNPGNITVLFQTSVVEYDNATNGMYEVGGSKIWLMTDQSVTALTTLQELGTAPMLLDARQTRRQYWLTWISEQQKIVQIGSVMIVNPENLYPSYNLRLFTWLLNRRDQVIRTHEQTHLGFQPRTANSDQRHPSPATTYPPEWSAYTANLLPRYPTDRDDDSQSLPPIYRDRGLVKQSLVLPDITRPSFDFASLINPTLGGISVVQHEPLDTARIVPRYWVDLTEPFSPYALITKSPYQSYFSGIAFSAALLAGERFQVFRAQANSDYNSNSEAVENNLPWKEMQSAQFKQLQISAVQAGVNATEIVDGVLNDDGNVQLDQVLNTETAIAEGKLLMQTRFYTRYGDFPSNNDARNLAYYHVFAPRCLKAWLG
jgi:hypothetical protein